MNNRKFAEDLIKRNRYLVLATTDGNKPWIAPIEYMVDDEMNFYFFSTSHSRHATHLNANQSIAVAIFDREQPDYSAGISCRINGIQFEASGEKVDASNYSDEIKGAIEAMSIPMPPYEVFKITPTQFYIPEIQEGINTRVPM